MLACPTTPKYASWTGWRLDTRQWEPSPTAWLFVQRAIPGTIGWPAFTIGTRALMVSIKLTHLYEKFMVAVDLLATSPGSLQRRLEGAYRSLIDVEPRDFDDRDMQTTFKQILSRITRIQDGQVGSIAATCRQMSDQEAAEVADFIFSLFLRIAGKYHSST